MNIAILLAAGKSTRAGQDKLWAEVHGRPLWTLALEAFYGHSEVDLIILVVPSESGALHTFLDLLEKKCWDAGLAGERIIVVNSGGATRMESFKRGLDYLTTYEIERNLRSDDIIIDHNAANPLVTAEEISAVLSAAKEFGAAAVAQPVVDTLTQVNEEGFAVSSWDRNFLRLMQTPQAVRGDILHHLHVIRALQDTTDLTTALLQHIPVKILPAHPLNKKITFTEDLEALQSQTFLGEDSHRFSNEGQLTLGGVTVPACPAMEANSDGDVILHAIGRALATAQNKNFSELADPLMLGGDFDSRDYLEPLLEGVKILDVSLSIEGAQPRIDPLESDLKSSLGRILQIKSTQIHLSAHTGEDLTAFGRGEGLRCLALVKVLKK